MIIGLTGSIASGKSTIAEMIQAYEIPIVDGDVIARQVVEKGTPTLQKIVEAFGEIVLTEDRELNRPKLGEIIFSNEEKRQQLNSITHPAIREEMLQKRDAYVAEGKHVVMDIPLLFESKLQHFVEKILVVTVSPEVQLERLMKRNNLTEQEAKMRIASQLPLSEKEAGADAIIYNDGTTEQSRERLQNILNDWDIL